MAQVGVIEQYVGDLDRQLRGPAHVKAGLLAEARDSQAEPAAGTPRRCCGP